MTWRCFACGKAFIHARFLTTHLIKLHGYPKET